MKTIKVKGQRLHVGCGGVLLKRICTKCGEVKPKKSLGRAIFGEGPLVSEKEPFDERDHKRRIREGRDILK